ncbi:MAG: TonB-dependent receptor [Gemmatimonadota bacterium]|nr:TonB-dependent receptor [Gemmatimonadota bacterium]
MRIMFGLKSWVAAAVLGVAAAGQLSAQGATATLTGRVTASDGMTLTGVQVVATSRTTGSQFGARTGEDGVYTITDLRPGAYGVIARMIGYDVGRDDDVRIRAGQSTQLNFVLGVQPIVLDAMEIFATRAVERKTPVAYSNVDKAQMDQQLGSQDIPLVLNLTPSVYSTESGGAAGDARINVRGFDQRNVAVMINGVPVNDMENGWVYWSNWDGVGDATSTIQLQRGLSAVNLATPSIGGTLNIITDATTLSPGGMFKQEFGNDGFLKTTAMLSSGLLGDKFAFMAQGVRKTGDGIAQGLWTDAWAYYFGASYKVSASNRIDLFALGAPQRHGQRLYAQNIGAIDSSFARGLSGYDPAALIAYPQADSGFRYNENWNTVSSSYTGQQAEGTKLFNRQNPNFLNERENFFHKPQVNLNWYSSLSDMLSLSTVAYYSGGKGGGTGEIDYFSGFTWDYSGPSRIADWDAMVAVNQGTVDRRGDPKAAGRSMGILRNSRNNQWTIGAISKLSMDLSGPLTMEVGADWRTASIDHYREVRDLLGGTYFITEPGDASDFWPAPDDQRGLGDKIDYDFTNTVDWLGGYVQGEYATSKYTLYGMGGLSTIKYSYTNNFMDDGTGSPVVANPDRIFGTQFKGGGLLNLTDELGAYVNAGYISKVPIFDGVVDDFSGALNPDPQNEKFLHFEGGLDYRALDRTISVSLNGYFTQWKDRTITRGIVTTAGEDALVSLLGLDAVHMGIEAEAAFRVSNLLRLDVSAAVSNWKYTDDVSGTYRPDPGAPAVPYDFYINDLKVGNAPQLQASAAVSVFPIDGLFVQVVGRAYGNHYADFNPVDRDDPADRAQSWKAPGYAVFDAHFSYSPPAAIRFLERVTLFGHAYNLLDETYILDAIDNSSFNGFDLDHDADDAEVFFGLPRRFNAGLQVHF